MTTRLLPAVLAGLLVGCGAGADDGDPVAAALGGTDADAEQVREVLSAMAPFSATQARLVAAVRSGDAPGAVEAVESLDGQVSEGLRRARDLGTAELRRTLSSYLGTARDYVDAAGAVVDYAGGTGPPRPAVRARLLARLRTTQSALRAADRELIARMTTAVPEDQRDELQATLDEARQRARDIVQSEG